MSVRKKNLNWPSLAIHSEKVSGQTPLIHIHITFDYYSEIVCILDMSAKWTSHTAALHKK